MHNIRNNLNIAVFVLCASIVQYSYSQVDSSQVVIGKLITLKSNVLGESRAIRLSTPEDYSTSTSAYPVLYLIDGDAHFSHISGLVSFLSSIGKMSEMIVVGIDNTDRIRDLTPSHNIIGYDGKPDSNSYASTGGSEKFFKFINEELIPFVEKNYRTQPFKILSGHSHGGLFTIFALLEHPQTFNAYIAMSPSLWWDNNYLLNRTNDLSNLKFSRPSFLYLSVGNEGGLQEQSVVSFVNLLKKYSPSNLSWTYKSYQKEWHGSLPHISMFDGLTFLYSEWPSFYGGAYDTAYISHKMFIDHFQTLTRKYGYSIKPSEWDFSLLSRRLLKQKRIDEAIGVIEQNANEHPTSVSIFESLAKLYIEKGDKKMAMKNYRRVVELDPKNSNAKRALEGLQK